MVVAFPSPTARRRAGPLAPLAFLAGLFALSACGGSPDPATGINDPLEVQNRRVHAFNMAVDKAVVRPSSQVYGHVVPGPVRTGVSNFASNLGMPSAIVNSLLQGRIGDAGKNGFRFLVNTTFGFGGLLDPATDMGLTEAEADFGQTLHVWGAGEGAFLMVPVMGPTTTRDLTGTVVDLVTDPLRFAFDSPEKDYVLGTKVMSKVGDRYRYSSTVDSILYESADSYAQTRLLYLQNRRFELGGDAEADTYDPYEDPYGQ